MKVIDKLGNYIEKLDRPNTDLRYGINDVCGITNTKQLVLGTKANLIGRTFEKFTVLAPREFIFNRRTSRNGERISLGYNTTEREWILTEDYCHFRVRKDKENIIDPDFLYLFFLDPEFDRYARFNSWGSATEFFNWEEMIETPINLLPLKTQHRIVEDYRIIEKRSKLLKDIDNSLFEHAKLFMSKLILDVSLWNGEISIDEFCKQIASGGTPNRSQDEYWDSKTIPWLKNGEIKNNVIVETEESISELGLESSSAKIFPLFSIHMAMYCVSDIQVAVSCIPLCTNQAVLNFELGTFREASFLYYMLATFGNNITSNANGSAQQNLSKELISAFKFKRPVLDNKAFEYFEKNLNYRIQIAKEIKEIDRLKTMVLKKCWQG